ncbi:leukocyte surface antigen CD53-like isoform X2 [Tenebrio molitor]|uniref:leukocyte surface antigen CD53-like isoform X2 n=1 Tax=Tenebrio molitor TaxID=7067 RepID=UPI00362479DE
MVFSVRTARMILFVFNGVFTVCGVIMFMLGVFILNEEANVIKVASFSVGGCLVSLGIFIVSIAVFGGVAAKLKRSFFLEIYLGLLGLVVVCQIAFGVSVFFALRNSKGQLDKRIEMRLKDHFDTAEQSHLDKIQQRHQCCGVLGPDYWPEEHDRERPDSCCKGNRCRDDNKNIYKKGCVVYYQDAFELLSKGNVIGSVTLAFCAIESR